MLILIASFIQMYILKGRFSSHLCQLFLEFHGKKNLIIAFIRNIEREFNIAHLWLLNITFYLSNNNFFSSNRWFFQQLTFVICQTFLVAYIWFFAFLTSFRIFEETTTTCDKWPSIKQTKIIFFCFNKLFYWILFMRFNILCQIWWYIWFHN